MNKKSILAIILAFIWVNLSEFIRNELLFKNLWIEHYDKLGLTFPSEPLNNAVWVLWSLVLVICIYALSKKYTLIETAALSWVFTFVLMWLVIGNLNVLPFKLLLYALPLSVFEVYMATLILKKLSA